MKLRGFRLLLGIRGRIVTANLHHIYKNGGQYAAIIKPSVNYQIRSFTDNSKLPENAKPETHEKSESESAVSETSHEKGAKEERSTSKSPASSTSAAYNAAVEKIGSTLHLAEQKYVDMEKNIMSRVNEKSTKRFRLYFVGTLAVIIVIPFAFRSHIKQAVTEQTAGIAKETLENESIKIQTQELAMAVVQTVLNDKEITAHAATFLKEASTTPQTQKALLDLTLHVLQHPQTLEETIRLSQKLINRLSADKVRTLISPIYLCSFFLSSRL
jgi:hypothetical protein